MKKIFAGRTYLGNVWYFYILFSGLFALGLSIFKGSIHLNLTPDALSMGLTNERIGGWLSVISAITLPWMLLANNSVGKWYTVDEDGIALIRFGFVFKKFYFKNLLSVVKFSTEETKELLYREFAPSLMFRRAPMEPIKSLFNKVPRAIKLSVDLSNLIRYSTVRIVEVSWDTGYQHPTVEDAKKTFRFLTKGPFVLLTTTENKHILISPRDIDNFTDYSNKLLRDKDG